MEGGLSFRKLHDFNLALIAKQAWRLLNFLESLVARIYKAKYYPDSSFLKAALKPNRRFIWRSVMGAKNLIMSGASWRVGTSNEVHIWGEPWLLDQHNPCVETPPSPNRNGECHGFLSSKRGRDCIGLGQNK